MRTHPALLALATVALAGCTTVKHTAIDTLGDALAAGGTTFAADDDPQLIAAAAPFSLKLMESVLAERPQHRGLLLATASGFTQYAFAFVHQDADELAETNFAAAAALRQRARRLYLRARDYGLRGLEVGHAGFVANLRREPRAALRATTKADVPLLYWTAAAWGSAVTLGKDNPELLADLGTVEALIDRASELDPDFGRGAIHSFLISYEMARPVGEGAPVQRARRHFEQALGLSGNTQVAPFVAFAESVCVPTQERSEFKASLERAIAIDVDASPEFRLANVVMQRRARWLLGRTDEFFPASTPVTP